MVNEPPNCILTHRVSSKLVPAGSVVALVPSPEEASRGGLLGKLSNTTLRIFFPDGGDPKSETDFLGFFEAK